MTEQRSEDTKLHYVRLRVMGSNQVAVMPVHEVADFCDGEEYIKEDAWMTKAEFEALPEFMGY